MKRLARHRWPDGTVLLALTLKQGILFEDMLSSWESSNTLFDHPTRDWTLNTHRLYGITPVVAKTILSRLAEIKGASARAIERQITSELKGHK